MMNGLSRKSSIFASQITQNIPAAEERSTIIEHDNKNKFKLKEVLLLIQGNRENIEQVYIGFFKYVIMFGYHPVNMFTGENQNENVMKY